MPEYFFPLLFLTPRGDLETAVRPPFRLHRRRWLTSTFDLATLAARHRLHLPYQLMDVLLSRCHLELEVEAPDLERAVDLLNVGLFGLYLVGCSPTLAPFATTHSVNDYSGINSRDSELLREKLPKHRRTGFTSEEETVEGWPVHTSLHCRVHPDGLEVSDERFTQGITQATKWLECERAHPTLRGVRDAAQAVALLPANDQALLHIWCALEALFPKVGTEVSFRVSLNLSQLSCPAGERVSYFERARKAYNLRSRVAHGSERAIDNAAVVDAWRLLMDAGNAIVQRGRLPTDDDLIRELLTQR